MEITAALAEQLRILAGDPRDGDRLASDMNQLARDVTHAVPSCLAVSITLVRLGAEITLSFPIRPMHFVPVLASLAVPLSASEPGDILILRAGDAGAFLLLADDLNGLLDPADPPIAVDGHLHWPTILADDSLAAALEDLQAVNQAIGILIDRGFAPDAAGQELHRRAHDAGITIAAASRLLQKSLTPPPDPG